MTISDVKKGMLKKMQTVFPKETYRYYSMAVVEGFGRPSFFTQIKPVDMSPANYNSLCSDVVFYITYLQEVADEADALDVIQRLRDLFGLSVRIGDRAVKVSEFEWDFIGTDHNVPEISVGLQWMEEVSRKETWPLMEAAVINSRLEE